MKYLIFLLFTTIGLSQSFEKIQVVGDTTDLKNTHGSGMILLKQYGKGNVTGGGFFQRIDSTFQEGEVAFNHPEEGKQWARLLWLPGNYSFNALKSNTFSLDSLVSVGTDAFTTTAEKDTVVISGASATDAYFIQPISETIDTQDCNFPDCFKGRHFNCNKTSFRSERFTISLDKD
jgi:hypothetical protein